MNKEKEYWEIDLDDDLENEIDIELSNEVNNAEYEEEQEEKKKINKKKIKKYIALSTLVVFLLFFVGTVFKYSNTPDIGFLGESFRLKQDKEIEGLQQAVVSIKNHQSSGTGFNISPEGHILTNEHVIRDGGESILVKFPSGESFKGNVDSVIPEIDFASLSIQGKDLPYLKVGTSKDIFTGQEVLIIGNPLGISGVVKKGEIIGTGKVSGIQDEVILIKGPVHKGSSGSPVFNENEEVIAIIFATLVQDQEKSDEIIGIAIPIDLIK
ncbi:MAG: serine protease [Clostridia bacterium]|nr:serine protease [Clostridia bacterium]